MPVLDAPEDDGGRASRVVLVGMMGSGKTTVGRLLAASLGSGFADTDEIVESAAGMSVDELFRARGEEVFRQAEAEAVSGVLARGGPRVVSVGGGSVLRRENRDVMRERATVVWLRTDAATLAGRVGSGAGRPLLNDAGGTQRTRLDEIARARGALYAEVADFAVDTDGLTVEEVAQAILSATSMAPSRSETSRSETSRSETS